MPTFKFYFKMFFILLTVFLISGTAFADVEFDKLYGSDLGMGIGARGIGLGGAFVSIADDPSAVYWNPAGLTGIHDKRLFLSAETPSDFSSASFIFSPKIPILQTFDFTLGLSYIRRLRFRGDSKSGDWTGYPSHLLDLAMVNIGRNFSGKINSKTCDRRISLAFSLPWINHFSLGINYIFLK